MQRAWQLTVTTRSVYITRQDLVCGLSTLTQGDLDDKVEWSFNLYDLNGDGVVSRDEMCEIVSSIYDLLGRHSSPPVTDSTIFQHVEHIFQVPLATRRTLHLKFSVVAKRRLHFLQSTTDLLAQCT